MPHAHGRVLPTIWRDDDFRQLSPEAQRLYIMLFSQSNVNNAGILPLQVSKWAKASVLTSVADIEKALDELTERRYVAVDYDTQETLVRSFMRNDGVLKQPNVFTNALKCCLATESRALRAVLAGELRRFGRTDATEAADEIADTATLSEGFAKGSRRVPNDDESERVREGFAKGEGKRQGKRKGEGCEFCGKPATNRWHQECCEDEVCVEKALSRQEPAW